MQGSVALAFEAVRRAKGVRGMIVAGRTLLPAPEDRDVGEEEKIFWFPRGANQGGAGAENSEAEPFGDWGRVLHF